MGFAERSRLSSPPLYGFDLLTDATGTDIDPSVNRILKVGLSTTSGDEIYEGEEGEVLQLVDHRLAVLPPGVLVTWQGSVLDLPLFYLRSKVWGMSPGLRLRPDHRAAPPSVVLSVTHPWCADWHGHKHLELRRVYAAASRWWHPLRNRLDPETLIPPSNDLAPRDPCKDANLARCLAERRWSQARKSLDRMPERAGWTPEPVEPRHGGESAPRRTGT